MLGAGRMKAVVLLRRRRGFAYHGYETETLIKIGGKPILEYCLDALKAAE
jgi:hypothetical protein